MSTTYPIAQQAVFTPPVGSSGIKYLQLWYMAGPTPVEITGQTTIGVDDAAHVYFNGVQADQIIGRGVIREEGGSTYPIAQQSAIQPGTIEVKPKHWQLVKRWGLVDVTGEESYGEPDHFWGTPVHQFSLSGFARNSGPFVRQDVFSVAFDIDRIGTLNWSDSAHNSGSSLYIPKTVGGTPEARYAGQIAGDTSYVPGDIDMSWLYATTNPHAGECTLETGGGEAITANALIWSVALQFAGVQGGPISALVRMRLDGNGVVPE